MPKLKVLKTSWKYRNRRHSFQLFVVVLYTCSVLYQLVSPPFAHAMPTWPSLRALDGDTSWYGCEYLPLRIWHNHATYRNHSQTQRKGSQSRVGMKELSFPNSSINEAEEKNKRPFDVGWAAKTFQMGDPRTIYQLLLPMRRKWRVAMYRARLKIGPQVAWMVQASLGRRSKQEQENNSPNLGPTF